MNVVRPIVVAVFTSLILSASSTVTGTVRSGGLTFEERVEAQKAIERVYWNRRIWPKENPGPKPRFESLVSQADLAAKVDDALRMSAAARTLANVILDGPALQAEIDRMAGETHDARILREIFGALDNDPVRIAECLARPALAERLLVEMFEREQLVIAKAEPRTRAEPARTFASWWQANRDAHPPSIPESSAVYVLPSVPESACTPDTWRGFSSPPMIDHVAVWTGAEMITFAGSTTVNGAGTNTGWRWVPATAAWSSIAQAPMQGRIDHTAVWSGTEMIVFGGRYDEDPRYRDGGRYNPAANAWVYITAPSDIEARCHHTAVWTGTEMIVRGGHNNGVTPPTGTWKGGVRYNPATGVWTPTLSELFARYRHAAVWTGSEMIVWGGVAGGSLPVGRYDPATNQWTSMTSLSAPLSELNVTAFWSGSSMLVWGGGSETGFGTNIGGSYDPVANSWSSGPNGGPLPRNEHAGVWTPQGMIVWGGENTSYGYPNNGGRYDPGAGWSSIAGGPLGRKQLTAVFTGSEMVVAGGATSAPAQTAGAYCVCATSPWYRDADGDGFGDPSDVVEACSRPSGYFPDGSDCDDAHASVYPGAPQMCDGLNNDCADPSWPTVPADEPDLDGDGWRVCSGECNDADPGVHPQAIEMCNGRDDDCDGVLDEGCDTACDSPEKAAVETNLTPGAVGALNGRLAWNGNGYGLVWSDQRDGNAEIYFARFDAAMAKIGTDLRVTNASGTSDNPWIVWTGSAYGIAWEDLSDGYPAIFFVRIDAAGSKLGTERAVVAAETGTVRTPRLVWTGSEYGLFWNDNRSGNWQNDFRTIDEDGIALGTPRAINTAGYDSGPCQAAWNGAGYVVTNNRLGDTEIYVVRLDAQGFTLGPEQRVTYLSGTSRSPSIVWHGTEYGLFWIDNHYGPHELFYARLSLDGTKLGGDIRLMAATGTLPLHSVAWTGSEYGLAWVDTKSGNSEVYFQRIDTNGTPVSPEVRVTDDPAVSQTPSLQWTGTGFGLAFIDGRLGSNAVYGARMACCDDVDADGFNECHECDDARASVYPEAPQLCDGLNNDCSDPSWPDLPANESDLDADGWRICAGDCNDFETRVHPGAPEVNDGGDEQCPGDPGYGLIDEVSGTSGFTNAGDRNAFCWPAQSGATEYFVVRSTDPRFQGGCDLHVVTSGACWSDPESPPAGQVFHYLVRANGPYVGSWGRRSSGVERSGACLAESACADGIDNDGDLRTDCQDRDCANASECIHTFTFVDTPGSDIAPNALYTFFSGFTVDPSAYILFWIDQPNLGRINAWCSERADFYRDGYLAHAGSGNFIYTGAWTIWWNNSAPQATWSESASGSYPNGFGPACAGRQFAWCSQSGLGGLPSRVVDPAMSGSCQLYDASVGGCGNGTWSLTIRVAPNRQAACGF